jgi:hypothetical protein
VHGAAILPKLAQMRKYCANGPISRWAFFAAVAVLCSNPGIMASLKPLLEAMRAFHYVIGITTPKPEHERKILLLWIAIFFGLLGIGVALVVFLLPRILQ